MGAEAREFRSQAGRSYWGYRPQWCRQEHAIENPKPHHRTYRRTSDAARRVGSLLEVGAGFHSELTGRENILLNGAILGMKQREVRKKFDEIVAFAGVERFLDTPVKHYSSGMYTRLAFSVAAHLEPEILLVDEVLAVGDADFQSKCLGKMNEVSRVDGRTVLFVSHNMPSVGQLTDRTILLEAGEITAVGPSEDVISSYIAKGHLRESYTRPPDKQVKTPHIRRAEIVTSEPNNVQRFGKPMEVRFWIKHEMPMTKGCLSFTVMNQFQQQITRACAFYPDIRFGNRSGEVTSSLSLSSFAA